MRKLFFIALLSCLFVDPAEGQNLAVDGSFEDYYNPPAGGGLLLEEFLHDWYSYITTPDLYNTEIWDSAAVYAYCGITPHTGHGMVGGYELGYFTSLGYNREYIQGSLTQPLEAGKWYYAEVWVCPMIKSPVIEYFVSNIGIAFTNTHYPTLASVPEFMIAETPEVEYTGPPIAPTGNWMKISGCFQATGGETKVILGNFSTDGSTGKAQVVGGGTSQEMAYYFFDDLLVKEMGTPTITPDTLICMDSSVTLESYYPAAAVYNWSTGASSSSIIVNSAGIYTVSITTAEGCLFQAATTVSTKNCGIVFPPPPPGPPGPGPQIIPPLPPCPEPIVPNSFTANADGLNDMFRIINPSGIDFIEMRIFNRWGEEVFSTSDVTAGWTGKYKDHSAEIGTYYYMIYYKDCHTGATKIMKGDVTLIR